MDWSKITEERIITKKEDVIIGYQCDFCNKKVLFDEKELNKDEFERKMEIEFFRIKQITYIPGFETKGYRRTICADCISKFIPHSNFRPPYI